MDSKYLGLLSTKALSGLLLFTGNYAYLVFIFCSSVIFSGSGLPTPDSRLSGNSWLPTPDFPLHWACVDSLFEPLPASVHIYRNTNPLDGKPNIAYYLEASLTDRSLQFTTQVGYGKRYAPSEYYRQEDSPLLVVNGTFFSFADNRNLNLVIMNGKIMAHNPVSVKAKDSLTYYYPFRGAIGINRRRKADVAWIFSDTGHRYPMAIQSHPVLFSGTRADPAVAEMRKVTAKKNLKLRKWKNITTAIAGGPVLIQQRNIAITNEQEMMFSGKSIHDKHPRTAMGYTGDGKLIILVVQGRAPGIAEGATLGQEAQLLRDIGCYEALNLDGGGSSCMLVNGRETIRPSDKEGQRPVPAVFMIRRVTKSF